MCRVAKKYELYVWGVVALVGYGFLIPWMVYNKNPYVAVLGVLLMIALSVAIVIILIIERRMCRGAKKYMLYVWGVVALAGYGFLIPWMVSYKNSYMAVLGIILMVALSVAIIRVIIIRIFNNYD